MKQIILSGFLALAVAFASSTSASAKGPGKGHGKNKVRSNGIVVEQGHVPQGKAYGYWRKHRRGTRVRTNSNVQVQPQVRPQVRTRTQATTRSQTVQLGPHKVTVKSAPVK